MLEYVANVFVALYFCDGLATVIILLKIAEEILENSVQLDVFILIALLSYCWRFNHMQRCQLHLFSRRSLARNEHIICSLLRILRNELKENMTKVV